MNARNFALHSLVDPVETLEQARAVMDSLDAWGILGSRPISSHWERDRVLVLPGADQLLEEGADLRAVADVRQMEAVAFCVLDDKKKWEEFPELGLSDLSDMVGLRVSHFFNGPDSPATMSLSSPVFSSPGSMDPASARSQAFDRLRQVWDKESPESPMRAVLRILANRKPSVWEADLTSHEAVLESLMGKEEYAVRAQASLSASLPQASPSQASRFRI